MIETVLNIIDDFLREQYSNSIIEKSIDRRTLPNTVEYMFKIDYLYSNRMGFNSWIMLFDNRLGGNNLLKNEIYFRHNNLKNSKLLINQLKLLGLIEFD